MIKGSSWITHRMPENIRNWIAAAESSPFKPECVTDIGMWRIGWWGEWIIASLAILALVALQVTYNVPTFGDIAAQILYLAISGLPLTVPILWFVRKRSWCNWFQTSTFQNIIATPLGFRDILAPILVREFVIVRRQTLLVLLFLCVGATCSLIDAYVHNRQFPLMVIILMGMTGSLLALMVLGTALLAVLETAFWERYKTSQRVLLAAFSSASYALVIGLLNIAGWLGIFLLFDSMSNNMPDLLRVGLMLVGMVLLEVVSIGLCLYLTEKKLTRLDFLSK